MKRFGTACLVSGLIVLPLAAFGQASDSLNSCQKTVAKESSKYIGAVANTVSKCLVKVAEVVDADSAADAAAGCAKLLVKLTNSADPGKTLAAKFEAKVNKACDPAVNPDLGHTDAETYTIGATTLSAAVLDSYCKNFGGDGTIDSFADWRDCIRSAAECQARQALAVQWPRGLQFTGALLGAPEITANADALAALTELDTAIEGAVDDDVPELACGPKSGSLKATGQTQCDQGGGTMGACPGTPSGQDGAVGAGLAMSYTDNGDGTITDNVTGLMWEKLSDDGSIHDMDSGFTWANANTKIVVLNAGSGFAGYSDWRLPNVRELTSLVNFGRTNPAMDPVFQTGCVFGCTVLTCSCTRADYYWSSTTFAFNGSSAWTVLSNDGDAVPHFKVSSLRVRAVRGGL